MKIQFLNEFAVLEIKEEYPAIYRGKEKETEAGGWRQKQLLLRDAMRREVYTAVFCVQPSPLNPEFHIKFLAFLDKRNGFTTLTAE
jgi:hypothetical protein